MEFFGHDSTKIPEKKKRGGFPGPFLVQTMSSGGDGTGRDVMLHTVSEVHTHTHTRQVMKAI